MVNKEGDTFWYHVCPITNRMTYIPIGKACHDCWWEGLSSTEKAKIRQEEYREELKGDLL